MASSAAQSRIRRRLLDVAMHTTRYARLCMLGACGHVGWRGCAAAGVCDAGASCACLSVASMCTLGQRCAYTTRAAVMLSERMHVHHMSQARCSSRDCSSLLCTARPCCEAWMATAADVRCARATRRRLARCMQAAVLWCVCSQATAARRRRAACSCSAACMQCAHATQQHQTRCMQAALVTRAACVDAVCGDAAGEPPSLRRAVGLVHLPCAFCCWHTSCSQVPSVPSGRHRASSVERSACAICQCLAACSRIGSVANARCAVCSTCTSVQR